MYDIAAFEKGIKSMSNMREERRRRFQADLDAHEVTVIPAKEEYLVDIREKDELVGAYCRVSTMSDEQVESYDLQRKEYEDTHDYANQCHRCTEIKHCHGIHNEETDD